LSKTGNNFNRKNGGNLILGNLEGDTIAEDEQEHHIEIDDFNRRRKVNARGF
jgi:hypothetical protein